MANQTIPNLPAATSLTGAEQVWIVQAGTDKRATVGAIATAIQIAPTTVASLPAASSAYQYYRTFVTDASAASYSVGASVTGGGSHIVPVYCTGSAWVAG